MSTHWRKLVSKDSPHLNVWDIQGHTPLTVEIESFKSEIVHGEDGDKSMMFLTFKGAKKALGCNVTNATLIAAQHGNDVEQWTGKKIVLRCAVCRGEECVRVDVPQGTKLGKKIPKFRYTDGSGGGDQ